MKEREKCPSCGSEKFRKTGLDKRGEQRFFCKKCSYVFTKLSRAHKGRVEEARKAEANLVKIASPSEWELENLSHVGR